MSEQIYNLLEKLLVGANCTHHGSDTDGYAGKTYTIKSMYRESGREGALNVVVSYGHDVMVYSVSNILADDFLGKGSNTPIRAHISDKTNRDNQLALRAAHGGEPGTAL
jgi:hypothetical protein